MIYFTLIKSVIESAIGKLFSATGGLGSEYTDRAYYQHTGFTSIPKDGAQGIVIQQGNHYTCVASADKESDRPPLTTQGDVAIYTSSDMLIKISASGVIEIMGNGNPGSIKVGTGVLASLMTDSIINKFNMHTHVSAGTGSPTGPPTTSVPPVTYLPTDATSELEAS